MFYIAKCPSSLATTHKVCKTFSLCTQHMLELEESAVKVKQDSTELYITFAQLQHVLSE